MRTHLPAIDCLDEKGFFNLAPITKLDVEEDIFGQSSLPQDTELRIKEIMESKAGDPLHNERHLTNAILLSLALSSYYMDVWNAELSKIFYDRAIDSSKHIKSPLLLGIIHLHAAEVFRKLKANDPNYTEHLSQAKKYFLTLNLQELIALGWEIFLANPLRGKGLHNNLSNLDDLKDILEHILKKLTSCDNTQDALLFTKLTFILNKPKDYKEIKTVNDRLVSRLLSTDEKQTLLPPSLVYNLDYVKKLEYDADQPEGEKNPFYDLAAKIVEKMNPDATILLTRLHFKACYTDFDISKEKLRFYIKKLQNEFKPLSLQEKYELGKNLMPESLVPFLTDKSTDGGGVALDSEENDASAPHLWNNFNEDEPGYCGCIFILRQALLITELFPQKIGDQLIICKLGTNYLVNKSPADHLGALEFFNYALRAARTFLNNLNDTNFKKNLNNPNDLVRSVFEKVYELVHQLGKIYWYELDKEEAEEMVPTDYQNFLMDWVSFLLDESRPFASVFPNYLAFRSTVSTVYTMASGNSFNNENLFWKKTEEEIFSAIDSKLSQPSEITSAISSLADLALEYLNKACRFFKYAQPMKDRDMCFSLCTKVIEFSNRTKDNLSLLKGHFAFASLFRSNEPVGDKINNVAKLHLSLYFRQAKSTPALDLKMLLQSHVKLAPKNYAVYWNDRNSIREILQRFASDFEEAIMATNSNRYYSELILALTPKQLLFKNLQQLTFAYLREVIQKDKSTDYLYQIKVIYLQLSEHLKKEFIAYWEHFTNRYCRYDLLIDLQPAIGWFQAAQCSFETGDYPEAAKRLQHAAGAMVNDAKQLANQDLLDQLEHANQFSKVMRLGWGISINDYFFSAIKKSNAGERGEYSQRVWSWNQAQAGNIIFTHPEFHSCLYAINEAKLHILKVLKKSNRHVDTEIYSSLLHLAFHCLFLEREKQVEAHLYPLMISLKPNYEILETGILLSSILANQRLDWAYKIYSLLESGFRSNKNYLESLIVALYNLRLHIISKNPKISEECGNHIITLYQNVIKQNIVNPNSGLFHHLLGDTYQILKEFRNLRPNDPLVETLYKAHIQVIKKFDDEFITISQYTLVDIHEDLAKIVKDRNESRFHLEKALELHFKYAVNFKCNLIGNKRTILSDLINLCLSMDKHSDKNMYIVFHDLLSLNATPNSTDIEYRFKPFIMLGDFLCEKDFMNKHMLLLFEKITQIMALRKYNLSVTLNTDLSKFSERLSVAKKQLATLQQLCLMQDGNFMQNILQTLDANKITIEQLKQQIALLQKKLPDSMGDSKDVKDTSTSQETDTMQDDKPFEKPISTKDDQPKKIEFKKTASEVPQQYGLPNDEPHLEIDSKDSKDSKDSMDSNDPKGKKRKTEDDLSDEHPAKRVKIDPSQQITLFTSPVANNSSSQSSNSNSSGQGPSQLR